MQMIHRPDGLPGRPDPFDPEEPDPLKTGALESSLWELAVRPLPLSCPLHPALIFTWLGSCWSGLIVVDDAAL